MKRFEHTHVVSLTRITRWRARALTALRHVNVLIISVGASVTFILINIHEAGGAVASPSLGWKVNFETQ